MFGFLLLRHQLPLPLRYRLQSFFFRFSQHLLLELLPRSLGRFLRQHLPLPRRNNVPGVVLIRDLQPTKISAAPNPAPPHLLPELVRRELLRNLRVQLLLLRLLHLGPLDLQLLDPRDVLGQLQLGDQVRLLRQVGLALEALQTDAARGRRERLRRHHLVRPPQLHRVEVLDADGRQRLLLLLGGVGAALARLDRRGLGRRRRRHRRLGVGVALLHGHGVLAGLLVADAAEVLRGLDEVVGVGGAGEAGRDEGQHPLLVHQVDVFLAFLAVGAQTDDGEVGAGGIEPLARCEEVVP